MAPESLQGLTSRERACMRPSEKDRKEVGAKIREVRERRGMTQREAAEKSFVTESAFRSYELGYRMPKREIVDRIAKAFGVRNEYLTAPEFLNSMEFCYALL